MNLNTVLSMVNTALNITFDTFGQGNNTHTGYYYPDYYAGNGQTIVIDPNAQNPNQNNNLKNILLVVGGLVLIGGTILVVMKKKKNELN